MRYAVLTVVLALISGCTSLNDKGRAALNARQYQVAANHFITCANEGDSYCMANLGAMWENRQINGENHLQEAVKWYELSARYGNQFARVQLGRLGANIPSADLAPQADPATMAAILEASGKIGNALGAGIARKR